MKTYEKRTSSALERAKDISSLGAFYHLIFHSVLRARLGSSFIASEVILVESLKRIDTVVLSADKRDIFIIEFKPADGYVSCKEAIAQCLIGPKTKFILMSDSPDVGDATAFVT